MKLSEFKDILYSIDSLSFFLENGNQIDPHFHITEIGEVKKRFIDCGGQTRNENYINMQLWHANDYEHRLSPKKTIEVIELSESKLDLNDLEIEVEYQSDTIGKYSLFFNGNVFVLLNKLADCLDKDKCGISPQIEKENISLSSLNSSSSTCEPGSGCC